MTVCFNGHIFSLTNIFHFLLRFERPIFTLFLFITLSVLLILGTKLNFSSSQLNYPIWGDGTSIFLKPLLWVTEVYWEKSLDLTEILQLDILENTEQKFQFYISWIHYWPPNHQLNKRNYICIDVWICIHSWSHVIYATAQF